MKDKKKVYLDGGLGNNLFQISFALSEQKRQNKKINVDLGFLKSKHLQKILRRTPHPDLLNHFDIKNISFCETRASTLMKDMAYGLLSKQLERPVNNVIFDKEYLSKDTLRKVSTYFGYWQDSRYHDPSILENIKLKTCNISDKTIKALNTLNNGEYIAIHFRLGDYLLKANSETLGILSGEFFKSNSKEKKIILFSNDIDKASSYLGIDVIPSTNYCNTFEDEFFLFGKMSEKIISNSTFSWWSAYLGEKTATVICPKPFYKNNRFNLFPQGWSYRNSSWLE